MRIAFFISSMSSGGAAKIVSNISMNLPSNWEVDIIVNESNGSDFSHTGNIISLDLGGTGNNDGLIRKILVFFERLNRLRELKRDHEYDCCISYMDSANLVNILTPNRKCKRVINVVCNMTASAKYNWQYRYIVNPIIRMFYNKADLIIALSEDVMFDLVNNFGINESKISVSYCSIVLRDIDRMIRDIAVDSEWFDKEKTVITAGRLTKQKGQWHLIRAFSDVHKYIPDARLCIFGEGELRDYLESLIKGYQLEDHVRILDFSENLDAYISHCALFVFPSLYEGFGTALQEALACGVACISTDYETGAREQLAPSLRGNSIDIYEGEYGILTSCCSGTMYSAEEPLEPAEKSLASSIKKLLSNEMLRNEYAYRARERSEVYDIGSIVDLWINDISKCVNGE